MNKSSLKSGYLLEFDTGLLCLLIPNKQGLQLVSKVQPEEVVEEPFQNKLGHNWICGLEDLNEDLELVVRINTNY